jgi:hypothetical protein
MDNNTSAQLVAICATLKNDLFDIISDEEYYVQKILKQNPQSEKNDFLIKKHQDRLKRLNYNLCRINVLLFPNCLEEEDRMILAFVDSKPEYRQKLLDTIRSEISF